MPDEKPLPKFKEKVSSSLGGSSSSSSSTSTSVKGIAGVLAGGFLYGATKQIIGAALDSKKKKKRYTPADPPPVKKRKISGFRKFVINLSSGVGTVGEQFIETGGSELGALAGVAAAPANPFAGAYFGSAIGSDLGGLAGKKAWRRPIQKDLDKYTNDYEKQWMSHRSFKNTQDIVKGSSQIIAGLASFNPFLVYDGIRKAARGGHNRKKWARERKRKKYTPANPPPKADEPKPESNMKDRVDEAKANRRLESYTHVYDPDTGKYLGTFSKVAGLAGAKGNYIPGSQSAFL